VSVCVSVYVSVVVVIVAVYGNDVDAEAVIMKLWQNVV